MSSSGENNLPFFQPTRVQLADWPQVAEQLAPIIQKLGTAVFIGEVGAGKTTLIQSLCMQLGVIEPVDSPTFSIVNEYQGIQPVYHFDLYRISSDRELLGIGFLDYLAQGAICLIEWPDPALPYLDYPVLKIELRHDGPSRTIRTEILS